jgi:hypothetical protein
MRSNALPIPLRVPRPWLVRFRDDAVAALRGMRARWLARRQLERELRELAEVASVDRRMLDDVGCRE